MEIRDLEIFLSVAKHLSYTRAGDEVNLSQPSVSIRVKHLEGGTWSKAIRATRQESGSN